MSTHRIDLGKHQSGVSRIFSGRPRGEQVRAANRLDMWDQKDDSTVEVHVPEDTISLTSSFFLGMFRDSVRRLKPAGFRARYVFSGRDVSRVVEDGIREAMKRESPLDHPADAR